MWKTGEFVHQQPILIAKKWRSRLAAKQNCSIIESGAQDICLNFLQRFGRGEGL